MPWSSKIIWRSSTARSLCRWSRLQSPCMSVRTSCVCWATVRFLFKACARGAGLRGRGVSSALGPPARGLGDGAGGSALPQRQRSTRCTASWGPKKGPAQPLSPTVRSAQLACVGHGQPPSSWKSDCYRLTAAPSWENCSGDNRSKQPCPGQPPAAPSLQSAGSDRPGAYKRSPICKMGRGDGWTRDSMLLGGLWVLWKHPASRRPLTDPSSARPHLHQMVERLRFSAGPCFKILHFIQIYELCRAPCCGTLSQKAF